MATMKAVRFHEYGGPDVLHYEDAPRPEPGPGEALVRVKAAGVNPIDWKIRQGWLAKSSPRPLPTIPGWDVAGVVERVGPGVAGVKSGDEVYTRPDTSHDGGYAQYVVVKAADLAPKPRTLDFVHAAAVPLAALTAWQALDAAGLASGQTILVHGASGGVGSFAVQLAKVRGAYVYATASGPHAQAVRELGADRVIDYTREKFEDIVHDADAVLDTIGGDTQERSWQVLKPGGVLVSTVGQPSPDKARQHGVRATGMLANTDPAQLREIARLIDQGRVKPLVSDVLPLADASRAHALSQSGHAGGKIVLEVT